MPFLQVCTRLCRGQSCVRYALRGPLPPRIRVCGRLCRLQSLMSIKVLLSSLGRTESGPVRVSRVLPLQRSRPDVRCRRDRAEPDGKRGNAVSECGAGDSEGEEAMHFRPLCRSQRGRDDDAGCRCGGVSSAHAPGRPLGLPVGEMPLRPRGGTAVTERDASRTGLQGGRRSPCMKKCHGAEASCLPGRLAGLEDRETGATRSCAAKGAGHRSQAVCGVRGCGAG